jgi:pseudaminic acid biosynthesis-associated methylase
VEVQSYALASARARVPGVQLAQASALDLHYEDGYFDLVFTSGVLIHISPADLPRALDEIHRCARTWIWGLEYYAPQVTEVNYRGHEDLLWKMDYVKGYLDRFGDLELVQEQRLPYLNSTNVDTMYLLKRKI